jgi:EpsI family protein
MSNRTFFIVIAILLAAALLAVASYLPARTDIALKTNVADFPAMIGEWTSRDLPVDELTYQILETRNLFIREYKNKNADKVYFYIVYSEDNRKVSHPPEVCLTGSGASVIKKTTIQITDNIRANKLLVENVNSRDIVTYWFKAGNLHTDKYLKQQLKTVLDRVLGKRTSNALIRLTAGIKDNNEDVALNLIRSFCREMEPLLDRYIP